MINKIEFGKQRSWIQKLFGIIVCASMALSSVAASPFSPQPQAETPLPGTSTPAEVGPTDVAPTAPNPAAPVGTSAGASGAVDPSRVNYHQIVVKFTEQSGQVSALSGESNPLLGLAPDAALQPLFQTDEVSGMSANGGDVVINQNFKAPEGYFVLELPEGKTFEEAIEILSAVNNLEDVETAYMEPVYTQASDHSGLQDSLFGDNTDGTHNGIKASLADSVWDQPGGDGTGVIVTVIDEGWINDHYDLSISHSWGTNAPGKKDHGTAVLGIIGALGNDGIQGIAKNAQLQVSAPAVSGTPTVATAIATAASHSNKGDIIVIPLQVAGPTNFSPTCPAGCDCSNSNFLPVEYTPAVFDAIKRATAAGIIVVEAAGNGLVDLDMEDPLKPGVRLFGTKFMPGTFDSGAIMVAAGDSKTAGGSPAKTVRAPSCFTNYGDRVDLQGWGDSIVTTGYGASNGGLSDTDHYLYTASFGGTSGAAAIIAGSAASLQGIAKKRGYTIKPLDMRAFLVDTGVAQGTPLDHHIGPLPDLKKALSDKLIDKISLITPVDDVSTEIDTLRPTLDWSDFPGAEGYHVQVSTGSAFTSLVVDAWNLSQSQYTLSKDLSPNQKYYWRASVKVGGAYKDWDSGSTNNPFRFLTPNVTDIPLAPTLYSPSNNASNSTLVPTFTWKAPKTLPQGGYNIQITTTMEYDVSTIDSTGPTELSYTPGTALDGDEIYYWRVQSFGTVACSTCTSPWTGWRILKTSPEKPTGLLMAFPVVSDIQGSLRPNLSWTAVENAHAYRIKYGSKTITIGIPKGYVSPPAEYDFTKKLSTGVGYIWQVAVLGKYAWSAYSDADTFTMHYPPPTPTLTLPKNNGIFNEVGLQWKMGSAAEGFDVQISDNSKFAENNPGYVFTSLTDTLSASPEYTPTDLNIDKVYYWRVKSYNTDSTDGKQFSEWSKTYTMKTAPPKPTKLVLPTSGFDVDSLRPEFVWTNTTSARAYVIQFSYYSDFHKVFSTQTASYNLSADKSLFKYISTTNLPAGKDIYWRVASKGLYGNSVYTSTLVSPPGDPGLIITTLPPYTPVLISPANGSVLNTFEPKLDWADAKDNLADGDDGPIDYVLQIDKSSTFNSDGGSPLFEKTGLGDSDYTIKEEDITNHLVEAGTYYWRVRSGNSIPIYSNWTSPRSYTTPPLVSGRVFEAIPATSPADPVADVGIGNVCIGIVGGDPCVAKTDSTGEYEIRALSSGSFTLSPMGISSYIESYAKITLSNGSDKQVNFGLVKKPDTGTIRIVLSWNDTNEMKAHLWFPVAAPDHITCAIDPDGIKECDPLYIGDLTADPYAAMLEVYNMPSKNYPIPSPVVTRNPTHGYGPVVFDMQYAEDGDSDTFLDKLKSGDYQFAVNNPTNSMKYSKANVIVYDGSSNITPGGVIWAPTPTTGGGIWWKVFSMKGETRVVTSQNNLQTPSPAPYSVP